MAMPCVSSENCLAVALVINRSRDGPAFVFHYPPQVEVPKDDKLDSPSTGELEDILLERLSQPANRDAPIGGTAEDLPRHWDYDEHLMTESGSHVVPWEHVAGFPARDLAGILTPARSYHKSLFHLSLDPLHCISYPIHVPENGKWKKAKKAAKSKASKVADDLLSPADAEVSSGRISPNGNGGSRDREAKNDDDEEKRASMTMFNLVFILRPKKDETKDLVDTLYSNIVKKANKAYKYSQQHSDFVWKESKRILVAKDKAREDQKKMSVLWKEVLQSSSLAASMQDIYNAVSQNKIAALHLDTAAGVLTPSFQIPVPFHLPDLPPLNSDRDERGLWLTSANAFMSQDALDEPGFLDRNFSLLLMDDEKKIIAELQAYPDPTTMSMVDFVRLCKPTMSLYQIAQSNVLTLPEVRKFAQHFIYWRRAIPIPPLHARDTYIVSPNCDQRRLPLDAPEWQRTFPVAPPLPNFLAELSQAPRPYKHFSPGKAHRPGYLLMLSWLMRRGWVTQLCTFAYVVAWPEIIYEVEYEMEAEEIAAASAAEEARELASTTTTTTTTTASASNLEASVDSLAQATASMDTEDDGSSSTPEPPQSSTQQAAEAARLERIANKAHREATERVIAHSRKAVPQASAHPSQNDAPHLAGLTPHIVLDAKKATGKEARYLSAIGRRFEEPRLRRAWQSMSKYFDGRSALESIALQEDMKRKEVWVQLTAMTEYLMCTRHW